MARYTGPLTKKSRRLGTDLVGNDKSFERRPYPPGAVSYTHLTLPTNREV